MLAIFLIGAAIAAVLVERLARETRHSIPRSNDDMVFV
jgi:hypothetical protein